MPATMVRPWRVERGAIDPRDVLKASNGAVALRDMVDTLEFAKWQDPIDEGWSEHKLSVVRVNPDAITTRQDPTHLFAGLLAVRRAAEEALGYHIEDFFLNYYDHGSRTNKHRDGLAPFTFAVGLSGIGEAELEVPGAYNPVTLHLHKGDALIFNNTLPEAQRPLHTVRNAGRDTRIAWVSGTLS
ncbi:MAG: hypothetical protein ACHQT9_01155 [Candidatus Saccharimonadales bacterium]